MRPEEQEPNTLIWAESLHTNAIRSDRIMGSDEVEEELSPLAKWGAPFWVDLMERVLATAIGALLAVLTADGTGAIGGSLEQFWLLVGVPTLFSFLKGILANLKGEGPSTSLANVSSLGDKQEVVIQVEPPTSLSAGTITTGEHSGLIQKQSDPNA